MCLYFFYPIGMWHSWKTECFYLFGGGIVFQQPFRCAFIIVLIVSVQQVDKVMLHHIVCCFYVVFACFFGYGWLNVFQCLYVFYPRAACSANGTFHFVGGCVVGIVFQTALDRKSTRLNSSHANISYAVF